MVRECQICGRVLRTGRKYCHEHRHNHSEESELIGKGYSGDGGGLGIPIVIFIVFVLVVSFLLRIGRWFASNTWILWLIAGAIVLLNIFIIYDKFIKK